MTSFLVSVIATILVLGLLVLVHEAGHYFAGRAVGVKVYEFAIGFGPMLFGKTGRNQTLYSVRAIPLGGFVKFAGMDEEEDTDEDGALRYRPGEGFNEKKPWQKGLVILAGPLMNFVLTILILAGIFFKLGVPVIEPVIGEVIKNMPAEAAGLKPGDRIIAVNGKTVKDWEKVVQEIRKQEQGRVSLEILRNQKKMLIELRPKKDPATGQSMIGISPQPPKMKSVNLWEAAGYGVLYTGKITSTVLHYLANLFKMPDPTAGLAGPARISMEIGKAAQAGWLNLLQLAALLSLQLGLFNLLPIPALDGSRLLFVGWEGLVGRRVDPKRENIVHLVGFALLLVLMVVVTVNDISQLMK